MRLEARFQREATPTSPEQVNQIVGLVKIRNTGGNPAPCRTNAYLALRQDKETEKQHEGAGPIQAAYGHRGQMIRRTLHDVSSEISFHFEGCKDQIQQSLLAERLLATLSGFFGTPLWFLL